MGQSPDWEELGRRIRMRREARGLSTNAADRAGGPGAKTWQRVEKATPIDVASLYRIALTLGVDEPEAREWFGLVHFDFDSAGYQRPEALAHLIDSLRNVKKGVDLALAAALRFEAESRDGQ